MNAEGYSPASVGPLKLTPKAMYSFTISIPTSYAQLAESGAKASSEHKYDAAASFYKQALTAADAPADLSGLRSYIETMETCSEHLKFAKGSLLYAKKMKDEGGAKVDLRKLKEHYTNALTAYKGIKNYMMDDKYDAIIGRIESAISSLPAMIIEGVVEDVENTTLKLSGVKIYGMRSKDDKNPELLATTGEGGRYRIELSSSQKYKFKILHFDPEDLKGYKRTKDVEIASIHDFSKLRVKIYK